MPCGSRAGGPPPLVPFPIALGMWASEGVLQRLDGLLHLLQEDPELLVELLRLLRGDGARLGRADEPFSLQDPQGIPDPVLRGIQQLREAHDADRLVPLHGLQDGNVAV